MNKEIVSGVSIESSSVSAAGIGAADRAKRVYDRLSIDALASTTSAEESYVVDERCDQSPAELVESKLSRMLGGAMLPISHLQTRGLLGHR